MDAHDVTVVIPTRDRWPLLRTALAGVLAQRPAVPRVIVVDDGSVDGSFERLEQFADPAIDVLRCTPSAGVSAARNRGLAEVETEWVAFLDDDDVWRPDHLARLTTAIDAEPDAAMIDVACSGSLNIDHERGVMSAARAPRPHAVSDELYRSNCLGTPSRVMARAEAVRRVGGFDESLSVVADWDLYLRLVRPGNVVTCSELSVGYMLHETNMHLTSERTLGEMAYLDDRYGSSGPPGFRSFSASCAEWLAMSYRRSGMRVNAARWYVVGFAYDRRPRLLLRAVATLLGERVMTALGFPRSRGPADPPVDWLAGLRAVDRLPADVVPWSAPSLGVAPPVART